MLVGILSMHRVVNYGSYLQALGLKKMIEAEGHQVVFLDIKEGKQIDFLRNSVNEDSSSGSSQYGNRLKKIDRNLIKRIKQKIQYIEFSKSMKKWQDEMFGSQGAKNQCDMVVIGSDEVFNCANKTDWGFTTQLLGEIPGVSHIITYAASCGMTTYDMLPANYQQMAQKALSNISTFSVRDKNTYQFVQQMTGKESVFHLDPVLVYPFSVEKSESNIKSGYVLIYAYGNRICDKREIEAIKKFAYDRKLRTVAMGGCQYWADENLTTHPLEILSVFEKADYVITDTFHGTILSMKYHCKFATIVRPSNRNKLEDLLYRLNLEERIVRDIEQLDTLLEQNINYCEFDKIIEKERVKSLEYLKENLR